MIRLFARIYKMSCFSIKLDCSILFVSHDWKKPLSWGTALRSWMKAGLCKWAHHGKFSTSLQQIMQRFVAQINPLQVITAEDILAHGTVSGKVSGWPDTRCRPARFGDNVVITRT